MHKRVAQCIHSSIPVPVPVGPDVSSVPPRLNQPALYQPRAHAVIVGCWGLGIRCTLRVSANLPLPCPIAFYQPAPNGMTVPHQHHLQMPEAASTSDLYMRSGDAVSSYLLLRLMNT